VNWTKEQEKEHEVVEGKQIAGSSHSPQTAFLRLTSHCSSTLLISSPGLYPLAEILSSSKDIVRIFAHSIVGVNLRLMHGGLCTGYWIDGLKLFRWYIRGKERA